MREGTLLSRMWGYFHDLSAKEDCAGNCKYSSLPTWKVIMNKKNYGRKPMYFCDEYIIRWNVVRWWTLRFGCKKIIRLKGFNR